MKFQYVNVGVSRRISPCDLSSGEILSFKLRLDKSFQREGFEEWLSLFLFFRRGCRESAEDDEGEVDKIDGTPLKLMQAVEVK